VTRVAWRAINVVIDVTTTDMCLPSQRLQSDGGAHNHLIEGSDKASALPDDLGTEVCLNGTAIRYSPLPVYRGKCLSCALIIGQHDQPCAELQKDSSALES
jgi:hypothetical protein